MGLILDSSVLVATERQGNNARRALSAIESKIGDTEIGISVITILELAHGAARANTAERRATRENFIRELMRAVPIHPIDASVALRAGLLDGESQTRGIRVPLPDLLIAATAIELGFGVATANLRHFRQVTGLMVIEV